MRVLVTGAFGFVGRAVVRDLAAAGHTVTAVTSRPGDAASAAAVAVTGAAAAAAATATAAHRDALGAVHTVTADLLDPAALAAAVRDAGAEAVCHLAALTRVRESFEQPDRYADVNTTGTRNLLQALDALGPIPFLHASTAAVYGTPDRQPIDESCPPAPSSPYGTSKLAADEAVAEAARAGRIAGVSLRMFNVCGAVDGYGDSDLSRVIPKALAVARGDFPEFTVNGDGGAIRDYVHVKDAARAFTLALAAAAPGVWEVFNLGATPASVADVIAVARHVTGHPIPVRHNPPAPEAPEVRADTARIRTALAWEPRHSGLAEIVADAWAAVGKHTDD